MGGDAGGQAAQPAACHWFAKVKPEEDAKMTVLLAVAEQGHPAALLEGSAWSPSCWLPPDQSSSHSKHLRKVVFGWLFFGGFFFFFLFLFPEKKVRSRLQFSHTLVAEEDGMPGEHEGVAGGGEGQELFLSSSLSCLWCRKPLLERDPVAPGQSEGPLGCIPATQRCVPQLHVVPPAAV